MGRIILLFLVLPSLLTSCANRDNSSEFNALFSDKKYQQALELSLKWQKSEPDNSEAYVAVSNAYFQLAVVEAPASPRPPGNGDSSLIDPTTGKTAANIAPPVNYEPVRMKSAVDNLAAATVKFPSRLDIWIGLAYLYQRADDFPNEIETLTKAMRFASAFPERLRWFKNQALPKPPEILVPETMQDFCAYIQNRFKPNWEDYAKLSQLTADYYPLHPYAFDNLGNYYLLRREWDKSEKNYLKAHALAPADSLILNNLGNFYDEKKDFSRARMYFEKTIALNNDPGAAAEAGQRIKRLEKAGH